MMLLARILAQVIDWVVFILSLLVTFVYILPFLSNYVGNSMLLGAVGLVIVGLLVFGIQYPFMKNQQTLGKGFFSLKVVSTEKTRSDITVSVIIQREILCKMMSCYMICLPIFFGKVGGHDEATRTTLVKTQRSVGRKRVG